MRFFTRYFIFLGKFEDKEHFFCLCSYRLQFVRILQTSPAVTGEKQWHGKLFEAGDEKSLGEPRIFLLDP